jgi:hypothetical protein
MTIVALLLFGALSLSPSALVQTTAPEAFAESGFDPGGELPGTIPAVREALEKEAR